MTGHRTAQKKGMGGTDQGWETESREVRIELAHGLWNIACQFAREAYLMDCRWIAVMFVMAGSMALAHDPVSWNGAEYQVVLSAEESDGRSGMFTVTVTEPGGPPLHVHHDADEYFYVLEGAARFRVADETLDVKAGQVAFVPAGEEHTYRVVSEDGGRMLTIVVPGGFEDFFQAMVAEQLVIPDDMARIEEIASEFNLSFVGPPLAE